MKLEQMQYIVTIYETGSISRAARKFYTSRPNISNAVKNLENELGFEIMERGTGGVSFTKKGQLLVQKCMQILKEVEDIHKLTEEKDRGSFSIVNPNCPPVENAFIRLGHWAGEELGLSQYQFSIYREYQYEGMRLLNQKKADLALTVSPNLRAPSMQKEISERGLEYRKLWDIQCNVNLSRSHPLVKENEFNFQKLWEYPFVEYSIEGDRGSPYNRISEVSFINLSKLFRVDSGHMRMKVISKTNSYGVGIAMPPSWAEEYQIISIPIPGLTMEFGCIRRKGELSGRLETQFMEFLVDEMSFLEKH